MDTTELPGRHGCAHRVADLVGRLRADLHVVGLMTVAAPGPAELARASFETVARLADGLSLGERSMGMSDDLEAAVAAGSTMVRIGRALFGEHVHRGTPRRVLRNGGVVAPSPPSEQALRCAGTGEGMAPSFMKKTMVYLGLLDDEYEEYDDLEDRAPRGFSTRPAGSRPALPPLSTTRAPPRSSAGG